MFERKVRVRTGPDSGVADSDGGLSIERKVSGSWPRHSEFSSLNLRFFSENDSMERCILSYCTRGPRQRVANDVEKENRASQDAVDREKQASGAPPSL